MFASSDYCDAHTWSTSWVFVKIILVRFGTKHGEGGTGYYHTGLLVVEV